MNLKEELQAQTGITVSDEPTILERMSRDASVFKVVPKIVAYPKKSSDCAALVTFVKNYNAHRDANGTEHISLSPRAGGTCMSGGSLTNSIMVSMELFEKDCMHIAEKNVARVGMGAMYTEVEIETLKEGKIFGAYPSSKDLCGIAGMIGNNASGEKSIRHGATIDNVERLWAVLADGNEYEFGPLSPREFALKQEGESFEATIYRGIGELLASHAAQIEHLRRPVSKCASGYRIERVHDLASNTYNLGKLFVGSQGTLGVITRAELSLVPISVHTRMVAVSVQNLSMLSAVLEILLSFNPESVETFDLHTFNIAREFLKEETDAVAPLFYGARENEKSDVGGGVAGLLVFAQFAEDTSARTDAAALRAAASLSHLLRNFPHRIKYVTDPHMHECIWKIRRNSFGVLRQYASGTEHAVPCIEDIIIPPRRFGDFIPKLVALLESKNIRYGFHGHIGEGALRIIPIFNMANPETANAIIALCHEVFALVNVFEGNMSADHGDGIIRTPFLTEFYGEEVAALFSITKKIFDPGNIFNPNKKVGGTIAHITEALITE